MKTTNKTQERSEKSNINFKAKFGGEALVTPIIFNPTADEIRVIKKIRDDFSITEPTYKKTVNLWEDGEKTEKEFSVLSLLCQFNPNELLKVKGQYQDEVFVNYEIYISPEQVKGKDKVDDNKKVIPNSGKYQVIDDHNQVGWVAIKPKQSVEKAIEAAIAGTEYSAYDPIRKVDPKTARIACVGEVVLYNLLFHMSTADAHRPNEDPSKAQNLSEFVISNTPTDSFIKLCNGDMTDLNNYIEKFKDLFKTNDKFNKIGIMLGVEADKAKTTLYQKVYRTETERNVYIDNVYRQSSRINEIKGNRVLGDVNTRLPKELIVHLTKELYPWSAEWGTKLAFKEITLESIKENETSIDNADDEDEPPF